MIVTMFYHLLPKAFGVTAALKTKVDNYGSGNQSKITKIGNIFQIICQLWIMWLHQEKQDNVSCSLNHPFFQSVICELLGKFLKWRKIKEINLCDIKMYCKTRIIKWYFTFVRVDRIMKRCEKPESSEIVAYQKICCLG